MINPARAGGRDASLNRFRRTPILMQDIDLSRRWRLPLLALGAASLALGILGGLWRIGWDIPLPGTQPATFHGALLVSAFFGTVIGLERAVAYGRRAAYLGPLCAACGGIATAWGAPHLLAAGLLLVGSGVLAATTYAIHRRQAAPHLLILLVGALCGVVANLLWLVGLPASDAVGAWAGFLVLTISGERIEHAHLRRPSAAALKTQTLLAALCGAGAATLPFHWQAGSMILGLSLLGFALWLLVNDVARRNLRHGGALRFGAICLVDGYFWLALGGLLLPFAAPGGLVYDAALHAVFLGFVFAMVMGHALDIVPNVLGSAVVYTPLLYAHVVLLNATLLLRGAGDLAQRADWRTWGGVGNALAIALFLAATLVGALRGRKSAAA